MVGTNRITAVLFTLAVAVCFGRAETDSGDQILARARNLYSTTGPVAALPQYQKALDAYKAEQNRHGEAITLGLIGNCYKHLGDPQRALQFLNRALQLKQELHDRLEAGKTLSNIGLVYWETGEYAKAIDFLNRAIEVARDIHDSKLEASALNNLSLVYDEEGDYTRSLPGYEQALALHRSINNAEGESDTLANIGGVYLLLGHFDKAAGYYEQALSINERLGRKPSISQDLGNLATCEASMGKLDESVRTFDRARTLAQEAGLTKEQADWRRGKASALLRLGKFDAALAEYRAVLATYDAAGLKRELVEALNDDGYVHLMLGDKRSAEQDFKKAIHIAKEISFPRGVLTNTLALADLRWRAGEYSDAASLASQALKIGQKLNDTVNTALSFTVLASALRDEGHLHASLLNAEKAITAADQSGARLIKAQMLANEAETLLRMGAAQKAEASLSRSSALLDGTQDTVLPWLVGYLRGEALESLKREDEAVEAYRKAITSIESVRGSIVEDRFRTGFLQDKQKVYVALVQLLLRLGRMDEAFQYSEKLRSRAYVDLLNRSNAPNDTPRMVELKARIRQLQRAVDQESSKPAHEERGEALATFTNELGAAEREFSELVATNPGARPEVMAVVPATAKLQSYIPARTAVIEYVVAKKQIAIFVLTRSGMRAKLVPVRALDLESKIELLRELIRQPGDSDWKSPSRSLRAVLIDPIENAGWLRGIDEIAIVPHGVLHYLPYAALIRTSGTTDRFLIDDYVICYLPAASILARQEDPRARTERLIAYAPDPTLPYTAGEARSIVSGFGSRGTAVIGRNATETSFKRVASDYDLIHFATHGYFNKMNPLFSGVELKADAENDGRLEVYEILNLRLKAQLVTLSACDTAMGAGYFTDIPAGDEFVGLTRAFLSAGASAVAATLWEVNDSSTAQLMRSFYLGLTKHAPAEALAAAQRRMLHGDPAHSHPYYWSAFVVVGKGNSVEAETLAERR